MHRTSSLFLASNIIKNLKLTTFYFSEMRDYCIGQIAYNSMKIPVVC